MRMLKKSILIFGAVVFLVFAGSSASAVTEGTGDIFHYKKTGDSWSWGAYSSGKSDIDLTSVDYSVSGSDVTVTLTVSGTIQTSDKFFYYVYLESAEGKYFIYYVNGFAMWAGTDGFSGEGGMITDFTASGGTFTATFTPTNPSNSFNVYGYAWEVLSTTDFVTADVWADYAPNTYAPWYTAGDDDLPDDDDDDNPPVDDDDDNPPADDNDDDTGDAKGDDDDDDEDKGIPGFEIVTIIAAIAVALIILRRKK